MAGISELRSRNALHRLVNVLHIRFHMFAYGQQYIVLLYGFLNLHKRYTVSTILQLFFHYPLYFMASSLYPVIEIYLNICNSYVYTYIYLQYDLLQYEYHKFYLSSLTNIYLGSSMPCTKQCINGFHVEYIFVTYTGFSLTHLIFQILFSFCYCMKNIKDIVLSKQLSST